MNASRRVTPLLILLCSGGLLLYCYWDALFGGGQLGYRDAAHFYYPLNLRVQQEWEAGRWPLWEPEENSGMPLLGNPTAAVLYPGKLIFAVLPYAWGARLYVILHTALACGAMLALMRSWGTSWVGSGISGLTYAFAAPVLFQYCNIIYLIGAAWLPLGFLAVDRWLRLGSRWAILGLAVVLSMQTLGGDPQAAYLLGISGGGYAAALAWRRGDSGEKTPARRWWWLPAGVLVVAAWVGITLALAVVFPKIRPPAEGQARMLPVGAAANAAQGQGQVPGAVPRFKAQVKPAPALPWMHLMPTLVLGAWGIAGLIFLNRWRTGRARSVLGRMLAGMAAAAALALALSAAQFLPVVEFTQQTSRAASGGPHDIYPFSLEPHRLAELLWPSVYGNPFGRNTSWEQALQIPGAKAKIWVPSLYAGGVALILAAAAFSLGRGPVHRSWLSVILVVSMLGSLGQFTSPIWAARFLHEAAGLSVPDIGPLDPIDVTPIRLDRYLRDGDGSFYWMLTQFLPGFRQFRFPSKLMTFGVLAIAGLAGLGWDAVGSGLRRRGTLALAGSLSLLGAGLLGAAWARRGPLVASWASTGSVSTFGPLDADAAFLELIRALGHGTAVLLLTTIVLAAARRRAVPAGLAALAIVTLDLAVANARYVATVPQAMFETEPDVLKLIRAAEKEKPADGPYRVHRMPAWTPPDWYQSSSPDRVRDFVEWERSTIQPKYGITYGVEYVHTLGVAELYDYEWFFGGFPWRAKGETAKSLGIEDRTEVVYFPRRSFDMWGSRYFILPLFPNGWHDEFRGYASFVHNTEGIYPGPDSFGRGKDNPTFKDFLERKDYQILRNLHQFPRAWIVHQSRGIPPIEGLYRETRTGPMQELLYGADPIWNDSTLHAYDPHTLAWFDTRDQGALAPYLGGSPTYSSETVKVHYPDPLHAVLDVKLETPGVVILADIFYPGWTLTIDDKPAPIYRANRMMRGAAVPAGGHRLVYAYDDPRSFRIGRRITLGGLLAALAFAGFCAFRPRSPIVANLPEAPG